MVGGRCGGGGDATRWRGVATGVVRVRRSRVCGGPGWSSWGGGEGDGGEGSGHVGRGRGGRRAVGSGGRRSGRARDGQVQDAEQPEADVRAADSGGEASAAGRLEELRAKAVEAGDKPRGELGVQPDELAGEVSELSFAGGYGRLM